MCWNRQLRATRCCEFPDIQCLASNCPESELVDPGLERPLCVLLRPYLEAGKRELLADYSLPIAVLVMSFVGSFIFADVNRE